MTGIAWDAAGAARIGASTSIAAIAADARLAAAYPGVAAAAGGLATPQIRHLATLGGNLAQRSRCWYYRNPAYRLPEKGRERMPGARGQPSLRRRLRSRAVRRAASLDHGDGAPGVRSEGRDQPAPGLEHRAVARRRLERRGRSCAERRRNDRGDRTRAARSPANARPTSARSAAPTPNGRWSNSSRASSSSGARFSSCVLPPAELRPFLCGSPRLRESRKARLFRHRPSRWRPRLRQ